MRCTGYAIRTRTGRVKRQGPRGRRPACRRGGPAGQDHPVRVGRPGEMGPNSDIDLLVIKGGKFNRGRVDNRDLSSPGGADAAVDVVVVTPEEVERYRNSHCLVICPAMKEGKVVYGA